MERLILFDIDGTLTRTQNGYLPFNEAIWKLLISPATSVLWCRTAIPIR